MSLEASLSSTTSTLRSAGASDAASSSATCSPASNSRLKLKLLPLPGVLSTSICPPMPWVSCWEMASPSPVPPYCRVMVLSAWEKDLNNRACCSSFMPIPLSRTSKCIVTRSSDRADCLISTTTAPFSVNLMALPARLIRIWPRRVGSPSSVSGNPGSRWKTSSSFLSWQRTMQMVDRLSSTPFSENGTFSNSSLPDSSLEKSRMSSMMVRSA